MLLWSPRGPWRSLRGSLGVSRVPWAVRAIWAGWAGRAIQVVIYSEFSATTPCIWTGHTCRHLIQCKWGCACHMGCMGRRLHRIGAAWCGARPPGTPEPPWVRPSGSRRLSQCFATLSPCFSLCSCVVSFRFRSAFQFALLRFTSPSEWNRVELKSPHANG